MTLFHSPNHTSDLDWGWRLLPARNMVRFLRWKQACRIQDESQLGCNVNECGQQRVEITGRGKADTYRIDDKGAVEILEDDATAASCDANSFNELHEVVADQNHIRTFAGDICSSTP